MGAHAFPRATGDFDEAWPDRLVLELDGERVSFIGRQALERDKEAAGREKDLLGLRRLRGEEVEA